MKKKALTPLGETEMEILHLVWQHQPATVSAIHEIVSIERKVAYTTIMTVMGKLAKKGYLKFIKVGTTYVYSAARRPAEVKHSLLTALMSRVFSGSATEVVQSLVQNEPLTKAEKEALHQLIDTIKTEDNND